MRLFSTPIFALALAFVTEGCLLTPNQGDVLCGADKSVTFSGYSNAANQTVYLQAAPSRTGPFTTLTTVATSATGVNYAGTTIYSFSKSTQITAWGSTDATLYTYVRAVIYPTGSFQSPSYLTTFDANPPSGSNAASCINNRVNAGDTLNAAIAYCASDDAPIAELTAPAVSTCPCSPFQVFGNLNITNANQAAANKCVTNVTGNLTVADTAPETVGFPNLTSIGGNAELHYERPYLLYGNTVYATRVINFPVLTTIGGNASLTGRTNEAINGTPGGLHAVTSVGGNIGIRVYGTNPNVFSALTHLDGDLMIEGWTGALGNLDLGGGTTLANLTSIDGDVHLRGFYSTNSVLNKVENIGGNLTVERVRFYPSVSFAKLEDVAGDLSFIAMKDLGPPWPMIQTVGGELGWFDHGFGTNLSALPVQNADVHSFRIENHATLTTLTTTNQVGAGDINIHGNPVLSQCTVNTFLAAQTAGGFSGDAYVSGTLACP
jgi:hypothetical protein